MWIIDEIELQTHQARKLISEESRALEKESGYTEALTFDEDVTSLI